MNPTLVAIIGAFGLSLCVAIAEPESNDMQTPKTFKRAVKKTVSADYLLFLPQGYQPKGEKRWPLLLFLHGAGERGTNLSKVTVHGPPKIVKTRPDFPLIVVSPQCPEGETWSNETLLALLDDVSKRYRVDTKRVYLTGLSMGGFGTWSLGVQHPERFAAIAPICGGGETIRVLLASRRNSAALKSLGVWAFHGAKDPVVLLEESERMVNALKKADAKDVKLTIYPEAEHDSWTETYRNEELYQWFLEHERQPTK
jgi:predicted peptidase